MIEIIELEDGTRFEYDPDRGSIIIYERENDKCYTFNVESLERVVNRMQEMGWIGNRVPEHSHTTPHGPTGNQILHG